MRKRYPQMINRQKTTQNNGGDLYDYFENPVSSRQRQYEAVRAVVFERQSPRKVAKRYGYKPATLYALVRDARAGKLRLFPEIRKGPKQKRTPDDVQSRIVVLRKQGLSTADIAAVLADEENVAISERTVERIVKDFGFGKLKRRTNRELGKTSKNKLIPDRSARLDFDELEPFNIDCPVAGVFFFIPYVLESGILDIVKECRLPESSDIGSLQACLSMLFFKLIGGRRLSHMENYDREPGLGVFAGLNVLPKKSYMGSYSCRCWEDQLADLQNRVVSAFRKKYPGMYTGKFVNLDFHSIPHYGEESEMEKVWCGSRGKTMKGANTVFAQDADTNAILYTRADILRREESQEVLKFVEYWKSVKSEKGAKGKVDETLVFDCKFSTYKVLDRLQGEKVKFVTLRKRHAKLVEDTLRLPKHVWEKMEMSIPKRKYKKVSVYESEVLLNSCKTAFRQIVVKDHGRSTPTFILTNNGDLKVKDVLEVYARRWRIEKKFSEMVMFFNLNALSSPIMIRIHFDILWTVIADTLYHLFKKDLRRFDDELSPQIFEKFVNMPGRVLYNGEKFVIKIRKRSFAPILRGVPKLQAPFNVPWLDNKPMEIEWTA